MDHHFDFDELAREVARGLSRREALRRLGGGFAGAMLAALGLEKAWGLPPPPAAATARPPTSVRTYRRSCGANASQTRPSA